MLILTRRPNESLRIGSDITVTVLSANGHQIRLGIVAPKNVVVDREEIYQRKLAEYSMTRSFTASAAQRTAAQPEDPVLSAEILR